MCSGACTGRTQPKSYFIQFSNLFRTCKFICKRQPFHIVLNILLNQLLRLHVFEKFALTRALGSLYVYFSLNRPRIFKLKINKLFALFLLHFSGPVRANETKEVTATFQAAERPGYRNLTVTFNSQEITGVSGNIFFYVEEQKECLSIVCHTEKNLTFYCHKRKQEIESSTCNRPQHLRGKTRG